MEMYLDRATKMTGFGENIFLDFRSVTSYYFLFWFICKTPSNHHPSYQRVFWPIFQVGVPEQEAHALEAIRDRVCRFCPMVCGSPSQLRIHLRHHTGEKPYPCQMCDYRATQKGNLKSHMMRKHNKFCEIRCIQPN